MEEVFPRVVFHIFGLPVRDTVLASWGTSVAIILLVWLLQHVRPAALEMLIEGIRNQIGSFVRGIEPEALLPFLGTVLIYLLVANNLTILAFLKTPTADVNIPVALAILTFFAVHYYGIRQKGLGGYLKEQLSLMIFLDVIQELSRTMSLSLRLFGNILAGEIIVAVVYRLVAPLAPLPMVVLALITGTLHAYIFFALSATAIASGVRPRGGSGNRSREQPLPAEQAAAVE
jgi:F-type H+-transporting ATPase subunit a